MKKLLPLILSLALSSSAFAVLGSSGGHHSKDGKAARQAVKDAQAKYRNDKKNDKASATELQYDRAAIKNARKNLRDIKDGNGQGKHGVINGNHVGRHGNQGGVGTGGNSGGSNSGSVREGGKGGSQSGGKGGTGGQGGTVNN